MSQIVLTRNTTTPDNPATNRVNIYAKSDGNLYMKAADGTETQITGGASAGISFTTALNSGIY